MWWRRGQRPRGLADKRFTFAYIFACVEAGTDNAFALVLPWANTEAMQLFLDRFAETIGEDEHVAMFLDQAGWHGSADLVVPQSITLVALPPYAPELNSIERVWLYPGQFNSCGHHALDGGARACGIGLACRSGLLSGLADQCEGGVA